MINENNCEKELIINKCLIIDDKFDEVKDIIFELNNLSISTDYRKDILDKDVQIDPNTQLVILDLYMSQDQNSFDNALQSVAFLNENIKGPFFLLIWTKHQDKFNNFLDATQSGYSKEFGNFPLKIERLISTKILGTQNKNDIENVVNEIREFINDIGSKYTNIYHYLKLTKIFQKQSTMFWEILKDENLTSNEKTADSFSEYYEQVLGKAFYSFDKSFNYEKSGKGFLNIHTKLLEHELTENRINYNYADGDLDNQFKNKINSKLLVHRFGNSPTNGLPGLIYKNDKQNKLYTDDEETEMFQPKNFVEFKKQFFNLNQLLGKNNKYDISQLLQMPIENLKIPPNSDLENLLKKYTLDKPTTLNTVLENNLYSNIVYGKLIITPYCDFANEKKKDILYLPILIITHNFKARNKLFKPNVKYLNLHNGDYIAYNPSMYNVCTLDDLGNNKHEFYISKEYVNEIQINVANNISRIGTKIIE